VLLFSFGLFEVHASLGHFLHFAEGAFLATRDEFSVGAIWGNREKRVMYRADCQVIDVEKSNEIDNVYMISAHFVLPASWPRAVAHPLIPDPVFRASIFKVVICSFRFAFTYPSSIPKPLIYTCCFLLFLDIRYRQHVFHRCSPYEMTTSKQHHHDKVVHMVHHPSAEM
jgi:hypothetical protein